jgi:ribonuclease Z
MAKHQQPSAGLRAKGRKLGLIIALATTVPWGFACGSGSDAMAASDMCFDSEPLPIGESIPSTDAICETSSAATGNALEVSPNAFAATTAGLVGEDAITIVTCGTGTPFPSDRAQSCTAVLVNGLFLLFDAGDGAVRSIEQHPLPIQDVDAVFLTHFHSDHIADLGEVVSRSWILGRSQTLPVYGGPGISRVVRGFNAIYALDDNYRTTHHGEDLLPPQFAGAIPELIEDPDATARVVYERDGVTVAAFRVNHPPIEPALGFRIEYGGRSVVVSGDTTETDSLREASRGADVLVAEVLSNELTETLECGLKNAGNSRTATLVRDVRTYHIGTIELAQLAEDAGVETLVLTHIVPGFDNGSPQVEAFFTAPMSTIFTGELIAADDGTTLHVGL